MANDSVLEKKSDGTTVPSPPIIVPAHKPLSHTAQEISDRIDAELSRKNLLIAAHGGMYRKLYKMRELRGAGIVTVKYVPTDDNTADLFTKVLTRQPFEKHRRRVMNLTDK